LNKVISDGVRDKQSLEVILQNFLGVGCGDDKNDFR